MRLRMTGQTSTLEEPLSPPPRAGAVPTVRVLWSAGRVREDAPFEVRGKLRIGRDPGSSEITLVDPYVSRQHAVLEFSPSSGTAQLVNLSRRGSHVGGQPCEGARAVADGDVLTIGRSLLLFRMEKRPLPDAPAVTRLLGGAPSVRALRARIALFAPKDNVVCIQGETGTGKELVARTLHELSGREGDFVAVNCAAIPDALAESLLFGHVAGAFTGAKTRADGYFRAARGGTLFLDEIGELPLPQQAKLLRVLETGCVAAIGSTEETPHGARVVTATHRDLTLDVREGRFRTDLYARISDFVLEVPPLRMRREDVLPLLRHAYDGPMPPLHHDLAKALLAHPWPLNVRELMRVAEQLRTFGEGRVELALELVEAALERTAGLLDDEHAEPPAPAFVSAKPEPERRSRPASERPPSREELATLMRQHRGVVADVAREVGRSRKQVYRWARSHGLSPEDFRAG